jgi:transposase
MFRSSKHSIKFANDGKKSVLSEFVDCYKSALEFYVSYLWDSRIEHDGYLLDVSQGFYVCPKYIPSEVKPKSSRLTGRALKCAATQASGIVRSVLNKREKDENKLGWKKSKGMRDERLEKKLSKSPTKPTLGKIHCNLNSILCSLTRGQNSFDFWLELYSLFNDVYNFKFSIPFKNYEQAKKWQTTGKILNGISISKEMITLRYEVPDVVKKEIGDVIGVDQGLSTLLTTSRDDEFPLDPHGHTLGAILTKLALCKYGSKGFARAASHRKNHINWLVKKLNLLNVKELKLENVENIKFGVFVSRLLTHWSNPLIRDSLIKLCEEQGVLVTLVANEYNSQRCNKCGWVQKSNRKGKVFHCKHCHHQDDADANASKNILIRHTLFELPFGFRALKKNLKGFFWNQFGLFSKFGEEITVPQTTQNIILE